jgi:protein ImuB
VGVRLRARSLARLAHEQAVRWVAPPTPPVEAALGRLIDTLRARLTPEAVRRLAPVSSHRPERSSTTEPLEDLAPRPLPAECAAHLDRPSRLLDPPRPIDVMLLLPEGPIAAVRHRGALRRCVWCEGPERIAPEWWRGGDDQSTRDYFIVETEEGRRLWIYHDTARHVWRLQGEWA